MDAPAQTLKSPEPPQARSMQRMVGPFALMVRCAGWMLTHEGIFRLTECVDAKTGGQKARWKTWKRVWPNS